MDGQLPLPIIAEMPSWLKLDWVTSLIGSAFDTLTSNDLTSTYLTLGLVLSCVFSVIGVVSYSKRRR